MRPKITTHTVELHRLGSFGEAGVIRRDESYLLLDGSHAQPQRCTMHLDHADFFTQLKTLRYPPDGAAGQVEDALSALGMQADKLLPTLYSPNPGHLLHVDLVLGAAELWALPFEACRTADGHYLFGDKGTRMLLTRRIRLDNLADAPSWSMNPRVLFLHAPPAADLSETLIDTHRQALSKALTRWTDRDDPEDEGLLKVALATGPTRIRKLMSQARAQQRPFTHVHVLAHGKIIEDPNPLVRDVRWGLRLGHEKTAASRPEELAAALAADDGLPLAVTVAACDSANSVAGAIPDKSFAHELHRSGIPIVLASQLPLTMEGSVTLTRAFYEALLKGEDGRLALHEARLELRDKHGDGHDWVSVVSYMNLPRRYARHLLHLGTERDMKRLQTAQNRLQNRLENSECQQADAAAAISAAEQDVKQCITSLEQQAQEIPPEFRDKRTEAQGVLASAHKRLGLLHFERYRRTADEAPAACLQESRAALEKSLEAYRLGLRADAKSYWLAIQTLALQAVLYGQIRDQELWELAHLLAKRDYESDDKHFWSCSGLTELYLLAPASGRPGMLEHARKACVAMIDRSLDAGEPKVINLTRDQIKHYVDWWTTDHGFFPGADDLAADAQALLDILEGQQ